VAKPGRASAWLNFVCLKERAEKVQPIADSLKAEGDGGWSNYDYMKGTALNVTFSFYLSVIWRYMSREAKTIPRQMPS
jgi:hypothetical protein